MYMSKKVKEGQKMAKIKVAAIQMPTVTDKMQNVRTAGIYLEKIKDEKPDFVILPEMFCCPYQTQNFPVYAGWACMAAALGIRKTIWNLSYRRFNAGEGC